MQRREFLGLGALALVTQQDADQLRWPGAVQNRAPVQEGDNEEIIKGIEKQLKCTCGCNLDIFTCRTTDFTCTYSPELHAEVLALYEEGRTPEEIIQAFVDKYGEQALMAPPARGFNLAGYLLPGILVILAGTILALILLRRHRLAPVPAVAAVPDANVEAPSDEDMERLRRALTEVAD